MRYLLFTFFSLLIGHGFAQNFPKGREGCYSGDIYSGYTDCDGAIIKNYILDELISIEMSLMNNFFYTGFEVLDSYYWITLYKIQDDLFFDLKVMSATPLKSGAINRHNTNMSF